jgi:hypothetical protein
MHTTQRILRGIATIALFAVPPIGCVAPPSTETTRLQRATIPAPAALGTRRKADVVSGYELRAVGAQSAADALRRLRPEFLRPTSAAMNTASVADRLPVVYVDGQYIGRLESLEFVPLDAIEEIRFLRPMQGLERWGPGCHCAAGVVHVLTRKEP